MSEYKVVEIFQSISGEASNSGLPATFVRFYGCNLRCKYSDGGCDTPYGYEGGKYTIMSDQEIICKIHELSPNGHVILTGGEPLIQPNITELLIALISDGLVVEIETNGSIDVRPIAEEVGADPQQLSFVVDYKCPCADVSDKILSQETFSAMIADLYTHQYLSDFAVKFVVNTEEDLKVASSVARQIMTKSLESSFPDDDFCVDPNLTHKIFISPMFGTDISKIVDYIIHDEVLCWCRLQLQIHKYIWDPDKRGV